VSIFYIKENDTSPALRAVLKDSDGVSVDLTGASVRFHMRNANGGILVVNKPATIVTAASGIVDYNWDAEDTTVVGQFEIEFEVTFPDGGIQTFPNQGYGTVVVADDLA
jgi:hypothetical protein